MRNACTGIVSCCILLLYASCNNALLKSEDVNGKSSVSELSSISERIMNMREEGLFDNILNQSSSSRSAMNRNGIDIGEAQRFITDTDAVLAEIASLENAEIQLQFIEALFNGGTVEDVAAVFAMESQDLSDQYLNAISSMTQLSNATGSRSATSSVMDIKLAYYTRDNLANRRAFSKAFDWSTIAWYSGFCAATIAGLIASETWIPWIKIAGYVAAAAGATSMCVQLGFWATSPDFRDWIGSLAGQDGSRATSILNGEMGGKFAAITLATTGVAVTCYATSTGRLVINFIRSTWNSMVSAITQMLPNNVTLIIGSVPIKPI